MLPRWYSSAKPDFGPLLFDEKRFAVCWLSKRFCESFGCLVGVNDLPTAEEPSPDPGVSRDGCGFSRGEAVCFVFWGGASDFSLVLSNGFFY